jgi:hypothetical protein
MCCKVLDVAELRKPANLWCEHVVKGRGCAIHETRPPICRGFQCRWTYDQTLGDAWKPDRCKFILSHSISGLGLWINVDVSTPDAWRREPFYSQFKSWSRVAATGKGYVAVCVGERVWVIFPEEDVETPGLEKEMDLKVGYRHTRGYARPIVLVRAPDGQIAEYLGQTSVFRGAG